MPDTFYLHCSHKKLEIKALYFIRLKLAKARSPLIELTCPCSKSATPCHGQIEYLSQLLRPSEGAICQSMLSLTSSYCQCKHF